MKRLTAALLIITLLLTGCASIEPSADIPKSETSSATESTNLPEPSHSESVTIPEESSSEETIPPVVDENMPSDTDTNMDEEGEKDTPEQSTPQNPAEDTPTTKPPQPDQGETETPSTDLKPTEPVPTEPKPAPPATSEPVDPPPAGPKPAPSTPEPSKPIVPNRPTSSATCRDTGSNEIWDDPARNQRRKYEETDPSRVEYLEFLADEGNPYTYLFTSVEILMYLGRNYGMPLYTSYEVMAASVWSISDSSVATINQVGFVVPIKEGSAIVTVTYVDPETQETYICECDIYVEKEPEYTYAELEQKAKDEAKAIADYLTNEFTFNSDLELIAAAATVINTYVEKGHATSYVSGYNQPFGTLITGYSSCAGATRALGLVLEYLGFEWYHVNEGQWSHQWCMVYDVDGQTAFADGSEFGIAGYGERLEDKSNWMCYRYGALQPVS